MESRRGDTNTPTMANSYVQIYIHITFHVKDDNKIDKVDLSSLYRYIAGIIHHENAELLASGGTTNHIHLLTTLPKTLSISQFVMKIKANSSRWLKEQGSQYRMFAWQDGYGAFSVSASVVNKVVGYINNQEEHHRKHNYKDEMISFLEAYHLQYDEQYI